MNQTQSIIVYRNPLEQAFWEGATGEAMIPVAGGLFVFLLVAWSIATLINIRWKWRAPEWTQWVMWIVSGSAGIATVKYLWI
jgi:hypothetical protein